MYKGKKLVDLVDSSLELDGNISEKEAVQFLKVGLLCVQEKSSLRPRMSTAIKLMTMNEINVNNVEIGEPGVITDNMDLKIAQRTERSSPLSITASMQSPQIYLY